jgi:hypothetical protein
MNLLICTLLTFCGASYGQQSAPPESNNLSDTPASMENGDLHTKKVAFDDLMTLLSSEGPNRAQPASPSVALNNFFAQHPDQADRVKLGLIHLLNKENHSFIQSKNPPSDPDVEDDISEHYAELIGVVSSLNDERAIPALVGAMTTGGMAQRGLLKYGDKALEPVLEQLKNPDGLVRATALGMSITLLDKRNDRTSHARIRELIRSSLTDPTPVVRRHAVKEIDCLDDRQNFVPTLEQIAKTDPAELPGKADDGGDGAEFYPVRSDARRVLRDIQNNEGCNSSSSAPRPKG